MKTFTLHAKNGNSSTGGERAAHECLYAEEDHHQLDTLEVGDSFVDSDGDTWTRES